MSVLGVNEDDASQYLFIPKLLTPKKMEEIENYLTEHVTLDQTERAKKILDGMTENSSRIDNDIAIVSVLFC